MKRLIQIKITMITTVVAAAAVALLWPSLNVKAFNPQPDPPAFGLIGVDPFETVRLNAVCPDTSLPGGVNPGPCNVMLAFRDTNGSVLAQSTHTLRPGQGASLDLNGAQVVRGSRIEVQPYVPANSTGYVLVTAEVFETNTGQISAVLNPTEPRSLSLVGGQ